MSLAVPDVASVGNFESPSWGVVIQNNAGCFLWFDCRILGAECQRRQVIKRGESAVHENPTGVRETAADKNGILIHFVRQVVQGGEQIVGNLIGVERIELRVPPRQMNLSAERQDEKRCKRQTRPPLASAARLTYPAGEQGRE